MDSGRLCLRDEVLRWAETNRDLVPGLGRLHDKLVSEGSDDHYVHAYYARKLHECGTYRITDMEASTGAHDVDIQLDGKINIRVWHGMNTYGHVMEAQLGPDSPKSAPSVGAWAPQAGRRADGL